MKKLIIILFGIFALGTFATNAEYRIYNNLADFEKEKGASCEAATDGCNSYFMKDGKVAGGTLMYCADKPVERSCTKFKDGVMTTKSMPVITVNTGSIVGTVIKIENGKDGKQIYILGSDNIEYTTAISIISDKITNGKYTDIVVGANLKINYDDKSDDMLFGNSEEIIKPNLSSQNDISQYNSIKSKIDIEGLRYVNSALIKYKGILETVKDKKSYSQRVITKLDKFISDFLLKFPQDKGLSPKEV